MKATIDIANAVLTLLAEREPGTRYAQARSHGRLRQMGLQRTGWIGEV
ncbi:MULTISPECIES: hypothetical protein [unclassified Sphingomonas]|nr:MULTISPECIES: hypothetical protein [unclassified Sphingomonas]MCR5871171.1 hypothetical protein [Sphingomonas sp. J344]UUY00516.1 hypothetical protein LRS08_05320 [Sphingomonas sp. J315]